MTQPDCIQHAVTPRFGRGGRPVSSRFYLLKDVPGPSAEEPRQLEGKRNDEVEIIAEPIAGQYLALVLRNGCIGLISSDFIKVEGAPWQATGTRL